MRTITWKFLVLAWILQVGSTAAMAITAVEGPSRPDGGMDTRETFQTTEPVEGISLTESTPFEQRSGHWKKRRDGKSPPELNGEWEIDYTVPSGDPQIGYVIFTQRGTSLVGQGFDDESKHFWKVQAGEIHGNRIKFSKIFIDAYPPIRPINYEGEMKFEKSDDYEGWLMEGHWSCARSDGTTSSGLWVSNPTAGEQEQGSKLSTETADEEKPAGGIGVELGLLEASEHIGTSNTDEEQTLKNRKGNPMIVRVVKGSPADLGGLVPGDGISSVREKAASEATPTAGLTFNQFVHVLRGKPGTTVIVEVDGLEHPVEIRRCNLASSRSEPRSESDQL